MRVRSPGTITVRVSWGPGKTPSLLYPAHIKKVRRLGPRGRGASQGADSQQPQSLGLLNIILNPSLRKGHLGVQTLHLHPAGGRSFPLFWSF